MITADKIFTVLLSAAFFSGLCLQGCNREGGNGLAETWRGYKRYFIERDGRVVRPADGGDTVSEGQAYAMLRAVWMDDKDTFDRCYRWTELNLSRADEKGDSLLAWRWKDGEVADWMPASDADIDYALSLIFAGEKWGATAPGGLTDYGERAKLILGDILEKLTFKSENGKLYLAPWKIPAGSEWPLPQNPSYYSPAHFRIFYGFTCDSRWLALIDSSYFVLKSLAEEFAGVEGAGLIPDWCAVTGKDEFVPLEDSNAGFGWEALRIPLRAGIDYLWFGEERAFTLLSENFTPFLEAEWEKRGRVYAEYEYGGEPANGFEDPAFYSCYYIALRLAGSAYADEFLEKANAFLVKDGRGWFYKSSKDYYVNSLAWLAEGLKEGIIVNHQTKRTRDE